MALNTFYFGVIALLSPKNQEETQQRRLSKGCGS